MRTENFYLVASFALVAFLGACGGGSGGACKGVCAKVGECSTAEEEQECLQDCPDMQGMMRTEVWNAAESCILDTPCGTTFDPEECMFAGVGSIPDSVLDGMATTVCNKMHECDNQVDVATCKTEMMADDDIELIKIFNDSTLNCVGSCIAGKTCVELQDMDTVGAACSCGCGIVMWCE